MQKIKKKKKISMWLAQLQNCLSETKKKKKERKKRKCDSRLQNRKWVELALSGCHLSAWHYASQMAGGKRASHQDVESNSGSGAEDGFV